MTPWWTNEPLPQIGDLCYVRVELAGLYRADKWQSPLIRANDIAILESLEIEEDSTSSSDDDAGDSSEDLR